MIEPAQIEPARDQLERLRTAFDEPFAHPIAAASAPQQRLVGLGVAGARLAVPIVALAGLHACPQTTPLPGGPGALIGLAGHRGRVIAVYDLATLLGLSDDRARVRWLLTVRDAPDVGLAVAAFDGHREVPAEAIVAAVPMTTSAVPRCATIDGAVVGVLDLQAIVAALVPPT